MAPRLVYNSLQTNWINSLIELTDFETSTDKDIERSLEATKPPAGFRDVFLPLARLLSHLQRWDELIWCLQVAYKLTEEEVVDLSSTGSLDAATVVTLLRDRTEFAMITVS